MCERITAQQEGAMRPQIILFSTILHTMALADWVQTSGPEGGGVFGVAVGENATLAMV